MILRNLNQLTHDPVGFLLILLLTLGGLVVAITVHEFSHALVATRLGDATARRQGRLTLNPLAHLDLLGSLMLLLAGFGWGKPVPVNPWAFGARAIQGMALVAFAGPLSNIAAAALLALPFKAGLISWPLSVSSRLSSPSGEYFVGVALYFAILYNLVLAVFNLIPLAPLDGSNVVPGLLPSRLARSYRRLEPWGPGILLGIILLDMALGVGVLSRILGPAVNFLGGIIVGHALF
jgi:Zn-dependent protease